jgi:alkanesulfonate monooxygenase SsuD/methylene tetrahydromethanopterin reductase-like flavin-dependent oxidoreductase (luciferase family)
MPTAPATLIESARRALGPVGAFLPVQMTSAPPVDQQRDAARRLERAGYPTSWTNEAVGGKDALVQIAVLLAATVLMAAPPQLPTPDISYPRIVAANGPKMLALAGELADGALPAMPWPDFTAQARQLLGPDKLPVVLVRSVIGQDASEVAATVSEQLAVGADHVIVGLPLDSDFATGVDHLVGLAPVLVEGHWS